jgi:hypothetical protein
MSKTTHTVNWDDLGDDAEYADLLSFAEAVREAAHDDNRVEDYDLTIVKTKAGDVVELRVEISGSVSARDFVDEVFDGEHGAW